MLFAGQERAAYIGYVFLRVLDLEEYDLKYTYFRLPERELVYFSLAWNTMHLYHPLGFNCEYRRFQKEAAFSSE